MPADEMMATVTDVIKRAQNSLLGKFRATVQANDDPEKRGRLKLLIPSVFRDQTTDWVPGAFPLGGNAEEAFLMIPAKGSHVLVEFIEGDRSSPIWTAAYFPSTGPAAQVSPSFDMPQGSMHLVRTRKGIELRLEDDGDQTVQIVLKHPSGAVLMIDKDGIATLTDKDGGGITLDPNGHVVRMDGHGDGSLLFEDDKLTLAHGATKLVLDASGATVTATSAALDADTVTLGRGASSPILNAQAFSSFFDAHVHASAGAPTAPPSGPMLTALSLSKVKGI